MPTAAEQVMGILAVASVQGGNPPAFYQQRGFANPGVTPITRNGAGDYTMTLNDACNFQTGGSCRCTSAAGQMASVAAQFLTTTTVRVRHAALAAAPTIALADNDFWIEIQEIGPN